MTKFQEIFGKNPFFDHCDVIFFQKFLRFDMVIAEIKSFRKCAKIFVLSLQTKKFQRFEITDVASVTKLKIKELCAGLPVLRFLKNNTWSHFPDQNVVHIPKIIAIGSVVPELTQSVSQ